MIITTDRKNIQQTRNRRTVLNLIKTIYEKPSAAILNGERLKASPSHQEYKDVRSHLY